MLVFVIIRIGDNMKRVKISLLLNILIVIFTIFASITMFGGIHFMSEKVFLESSSISMFRFFTVDSNILMGICSLIFIFYDICLLKGKIKEIPSYMYIFKLMSTAAVSLTFLVVFSYLGIIAGYYNMILNSNLFFHLITPLLSIITFVFFEKNNLKFKYSFLGMVPTILYEIYYIINILVHVENGSVSPMYDWYWFVQGGLYQIFFVAPGILLITYLISSGLMKGSKVK